MKMLRLFLLILTVAGSPAVAAEQITLVVGFAAGGTSDYAARILANALSSRSGERVLVLNKPGADGLLAAEWVRDQLQDGKTLLVMSSTSLLEVSPALGLVPVALVAEFDYVLVARSKEFEGLDDFISQSRLNKKLEMVGTAGAKSVARLLAERFFRTHGLAMTHVPFNGSNPAVLHVLGGHIPLAMVPSPDVNGRLDLMKVAQSGKDFPETGWMAIFAPQGTSETLRNRLEEEFVGVVERAQTKLVDKGFRPKWQSGMELAARHQKEFGTLQAR